MALAPRPGQSAQGAWIESEFGARALALQEGCARWSSLIDTIPDTIRSRQFFIVSDVFGQNNLWFLRGVDNNFFIYNASVLWNVGTGSYQIFNWPNNPSDEELGYWRNPTATPGELGGSIYHLALVEKPSEGFGYTALVKMTTGGSPSVIYQVPRTTYETYGGLAPDPDNNNIWFALRASASSTVDIFKYNASAGTTSQIYSSITLPSGGVSAFIDSECGYYFAGPATANVVYGLRLDGSSTSPAQFGSSYFGFVPYRTKQFQGQRIFLGPDQDFDHQVARAYLPTPLFKNYYDDVGTEFVETAPSTDMQGAALSLDETKVYSLDYGNLTLWPGIVASVESVNLTGVPKYPSGTWPETFIQRITFTFPFAREQMQGANHDITGVTSGAGISQIAVIDGETRYQGLITGRVATGLNVANGTTRYVVLEDSITAQGWIPGESVTTSTRYRNMGLYAFELCDSPVTPLCVTPTPFVGRWTFDFNSDIGGTSAHLGTCNGDSFKEVTATPPETIYQHSIFIQSNTYGAISFAGNTVPFYFDDVRVVRNDTGESIALGPLCPVGSTGGFGLVATNGLQVFGTYLGTIRIAADDGTAQTYASSSKSYFASDISNTDGRAEPWPDLYDVESGISLWFPGAPEA